MPNAPGTRTALFLDFDNVFLCLKNVDSDLATRFAENPGKWLSWLEGEIPDYLGGFGQRRILMRRCYMNPRTFYRYRPEFIRAAFEVVDCPPLTLGGKTSTDIHMVMEMMDALSHETRFDEFIVLSGDADFTPILVRLREHDRRTLVVPVGPASAAYKAAADRVVEQDELIEKGLGIEPAEETVSHLRMAHSNVEALRRIAKAIAVAVAGAGPLSADQIPSIFKQHSEFGESSDWLGFGSLRRMTEAVIASSDELTISDDDDPWTVNLMPQDSVDGLLEDNGSSWVRPKGIEVSEFIAKALRSAAEPVNMARLAQQLCAKFGDDLRARKWQGAGSFRSFLAQLDLQGLKISSLTPGYVYDPVRHDAPQEKSIRGEFKSEYGELGALASRIHYVTDTPYLMPRVYAVLLTEIAKEINENGFHLVQTSKNVRDRCNGKGVGVSRANVNFVLRGATFSGHKFGENGGGESPEAIGEFLVKNTEILCERADMELSDEEQVLVREWILAGLSAEPATGLIVRNSPLVPQP